LFIGSVEYSGQAAEPALTNLFWGVTGRSQYYR
jgi:hypothetical protein